MVKKATKVKLLIALCGVAVVSICLLVFVGFTSKEPPPSPPAPKSAQNECSSLAFTNYSKAQLALGQQQGDEPLPSVDQIIARRRLQEQFCLQFARCPPSDASASSQLAAWQYSTFFRSCLRNEGLEEYDAVPREDFVLIQHGSLSLPLGVAFLAFAVIGWRLARASKPEAALLAWGICLVCVVGVAVFG